MGNSHFFQIALELINKIIIFCPILMKHGKDERK